MKDVSKLIENVEKVKIDNKLDGKVIETTLILSLLNIKAIEELTHAIRMATR